MGNASPSPMRQPQQEAERDTLSRQATEEQIRHGRITKDDRSSSQKIQETQKALNHKPYLRRRREAIIARAIKLNYQCWKDTFQTGCLKPETVSCSDLAC